MTSPTGRPSYAVLRQDEDWSSLRDPARRTDPLDRFKYVPLSSDGSVWASFAVDAYVSFRGIGNGDLGLTPGFDDTYNTRFNLHAALEFGGRFRVYAALKHGHRFDKSGPVAPPDRDRLDLHQAFGEVLIGDAVGRDPGDVMIRLGRQELNYGDGRLIAARVGPNVRSDYDGALARVRLNRVTADLIAFRGVTDGPGVFDNRPDRGRTIWGVYSTISGRVVNLDALFLSQRRAVSPYALVDVPLSEVRRTFGLRLWSPGADSGWRIGLGANYQFGRARDPGDRSFSIGAWSLAFNVERQERGMALKPAAGLEVGISSGDRDPTDGRIGTFRSLAPPGRLTGVADGFGPGNLAGVRPYVDIHPADALRVRAKATAYWRVLDTDGLYSLAPSVISRPAAGARFAGVEPGLELEWRLDGHWTLTGFASDFVVGRGIGRSSLRDSVSYLEATLSFRL